MDRSLAEIESAFLRITNNARTRADDIKYTQKQEDAEYRAQLRSMFAMVDRVRKALTELIERFPEEESNPPPTQLPKTNSGPQAQVGEKIPGFLAAGPKT
jgi:hypothetical protein